MFVQIHDLKYKSFSDLLYMILKPFIWIEDFFFLAQGHDATERRVNTKCVPPSMAFYVSLFDIFYPKSTQ